MSEPVKFEFDLLDRFSGVADRMTSALDRFDRGGERAKKTTQALEVELGKVSALGGSVDLDKFGKLFAGGLAAGVFTFGISEGVSILADGLAKAVDLAEELVEKAIDLTREWIKIGGESEKLRFSQDLALGGKGGAKLREYVSGIKIGGYDDDALAKALQPLLVAGVRGQRLKDITAAAGDVEALTAGQMKFDQALAAFQRVQTGQRLDLRAVRSFGLEASEVFGRIGEALRISPEAAMKRASTGAVRVDDLMNALFASIAAKTSRGLGSGGRDLADTVSAKLARIQALPDNYLKKISESAGYGQFSSFLDKILEKLDPEGPTGQRIIAGLERLANKLLGFFDGIDDDTINRVVDGILAVGDAIVESIPALRDLGAAVSMAVKLLGDLWEIASKLNNATLGPLLRLNDTIGNALFGGSDAEARQAAFYEAWKRHGKAAGAGMAAGVREELQIKSPSRVFLEIGERAGEGFALGVPQGAGDAGTALTPTTPALAGGRTITIESVIGQIVFQGTAAPIEQVEQAKSELQRILLGALSSVLDEELESAGGES